MWRSQMQSSNNSVIFFQMKIYDFLSKLQFFHNQDDEFNNM